MLSGCQKGEEAIELQPVIVPVADTTEATTDKENATESATESLTESEKEISPKVERKLKKMSLHEKVCQMFIDTPEKASCYSELTYVDDWYKTNYAEYPIGGLIYFDANIVWEQQLKDLLTDTQTVSMENTGIGLFQSVDEEGGSVTRVQRSLWKTPVDNMAELGKLNDYNTTYEAGITIGSYLSELGFNVNFAPVADVNLNENNELGNRIFSSDPIVVGDMCTAMIKGMKSQKITSTLKHFPGLGAGSGNTHYDTVEIDRSLEELKIAEFLAFKGGIDAGADFVMVGHQVVSGAGDKLPADLSDVVVTDWLRNELKFNGIIITDSQAMGAITNKYTSDEAAIKSIQAGVDIVLMPYDLRIAVDGVEKAVKSGKIKEERIDESVVRILEKKQEMGLLD